MKKLLIVNNIPTSYRAFMFGKMHEIGKRFDVDVMVAFQSCRRAGRPWNSDNFVFKFPHYFSKRFGSADKLHDVFTCTTVNFDVLRDIYKSRYDWVLMAPFMCINNWIASVLPSTTKRLLWSESNLQSTVHMGLAARKLKKFLATRYDTLVCPGEKAVDYLAFLAPGIERKHIIYLPNLVDPMIFIDHVRFLRSKRQELRAHLQIPSDTLVLAAAGRLINTKGFDLLLDGCKDLRANYLLLIAGDGPNRQLYCDFIEKHGLNGKVKLLGQKSESELCTIFACADWFVHPARSDPSPLVVIEAISAGLPVAVSKETGNSQETVVEDFNGFTFDAQKEAARQALLKIISLPVAKRQEMASASIRLAQERFDPNYILEKFFNELISGL